MNLTKTLSRFQGQEVEIVISLAVATSGQPQQESGFMRFAGIAASETALLEEIESEISANRSLDLHKQFDHEQDEIITEQSF